MPLLGVKLILHLSSGGKVELFLGTEEEAEEIAAQLAEAINAPGKAHWHLIENVLVFTGAVSAIEVLD